MSAGPANPKTIFLYLPITRARQYRPLVRSGRGAIKSAVLRARDRIAWRCGFGIFDHQAWRRVEYTNRGDIAIGEAVRGLLEDAFRGAQFVELNWGDLDSAAVERINETADLFVIGGGGYVSADAATGGLSRVMNDVARLAEIRCPVVAFGIGYNCILDCPRDRWVPLAPETVEKLKALAAACDLIGVRDDKLASIIRETSGASVSLIGDPALFLPSRHSVAPRRKSERLLAGLNFSLHGPITAAIFRQHFDAYVAFLHRFQRTYSAEYRYFIHCETERIAIDLLRARGVEVDIVDLPPSEMVAAYAQMDLVICQMLHSSILATNAGVPSMCIGYDVKNESYYRLMGDARLCVPHDWLSADKLWQAAEHLLTDRRIFAERLAEAKRTLRATTEEFLVQVQCVTHFRN
jgi:polysaccharide pyruvyl transferase WcaK-like protein